jgi:hypothetical protein
LAIPVLLILAVLWAAVLIPPILRSRNAGQGSTIGDYTQRLGVLGNHSVSHLGRTSARPRRHLHVVPPAPNGSTRRPVTRARPPATNGSRVARPAPVVTAAQKRRREVLFLLAGAVGATLLLLLVVRSPLVLLLQLLTDVALGGYIYLLIRYTHHRPVRASVYANAPVGPSRTVVSIRHPDPPARPELAEVPEFALYRTASR